MILLLLPTFRVRPSFVMLAEDDRAGALGAKKAERGRSRVLGSALGCLVMLRPAWFLQNLAGCVLSSMVLRAFLIIRTMFLAEVS